MGAVSSPPRMDRAFQPNEPPPPPCAVRKLRIHSPPTRPLGIDTGSRLFPLLSRGDLGSLGCRNGRRRRRMMEVIHECLLLLLLCRRLSFSLTCVGQYLFRHALLLRLFLAAEGRICEKNSRLFSPFTFGVARFPKNEDEWSLRRPLSLSLPLRSRQECPFVQYLSDEEKKGGKSDFLAPAVKATQCASV